jgi:2-polyprenyl-3-methyl-5-hydroxy-6-metoxy-1,4-benzoquinol methylase
MSKTLNEKTFTDFGCGVGKFTAEVAQFIS